MKPLCATLRFKGSCVNQDGSAVRLCDAWLKRIGSWLSLTRACLSRPKSSAQQKAPQAGLCFASAQPDAASAHQAGASALPGVTALGALLNLAEMFCRKASSPEPLPMTFSKA